jgi:hypothetical protein
MSCRYTVLRSSCARIQSDEPLQAEGDPSSEDGRLPGEAQVRVPAPGDRAAGGSLARLLAALADIGVEPDYELIEHAKALVDEVNKRLRSRHSKMLYSVTFCAVGRSGPRPGALAGPDCLAAS